MPIYEFKCTNCERVVERYFHVQSKVREVECQICSSPCKKIISRFNFSFAEQQKLSGVDDTDDLTLGKIVAEGGIPAEHKRKVREQVDRVKKHKEKAKEFSKRQQEVGFTEDARGQ
jgi:putative FmdB family regulatory protein